MTPMKPIAGSAAIRLPAIMESSHSTRIAIAALAIAVVLRRRRRMRKRRNRVVWTREWILRRESQGAFRQLMNELRLCDVSSYRNFVRMDAVTFEELLTSVAPRITYQDTLMRQALPPGERLAITLRFLATGMDCYYKYLCMYILWMSFDFI